MSSHVLTEASINQLITVSKMVANPRARAKTHCKSLCRNYEVSSVDGLEFSVFLRQHTEMEDNFSAGLAWLPPGGGSIILIRCNGPSHKHKNHVEGETFSGRCHIHVATERYLSRGMESAGYAEVTGAYWTLDGATHELATRASISGLTTRPDNPDLFESPPT